MTATWHDTPEATVSNSTTLRAVDAAPGSPWAALVADVAVWAPAWPPPACRHLLAGRQGDPYWPTLCASHPQTGVCCGECVLAHGLADHPPQGDGPVTGERACELCGRHGDLVGIVVTVPADGPVDVTNLAGRHRLIPGPLLVYGIACCRATCDDAAGTQGAAGPREQGGRA